MFQWQRCWEICQDILEALLVRNATSHRELQVVVTFLWSWCSKALGSTDMSWHHLKITIKAAQPAKHSYNEQTYCNRYFSDLVFGRVVDGPTIILLGNLPENSGNSFSVSCNNLKSVARSEAVTCLCNACWNAFGSTTYIKKNLLSKYTSGKNVLPIIYNVSHKTVRFVKSIKILVNCVK